MLKDLSFALALSAVLFFGVGWAKSVLAQPDPNPRDAIPATALVTDSDDAAPASTLQTLAASLTIFVLAIFVGFEVIAKVPPTLHTPLMSGSNAISGITVVGAIIVTGVSEGLPAFFGMLAVLLAMINVAGGFLVTHRMLGMFRRK